jgi:integrase/recombinase XerD
VDIERTLPTSPEHALSEMIVGGFLLRYPAKTRASYRIHLRQWFTWCQSKGIDVLAAQRGHIEAWARHLEEERGLKLSSVASKLNAVCGMYRFAAMDGYLANDPGVHVRRPKIDFVSTTRGLSRSELADLLRVAEEESATAYAWVCLLSLNGLRVGELLDADVTHLGFERGYRTLHLPHRKGGKVATLSLAVRTAWAVEKAIAGRSSGPLLLGANGERLHVAALRRALRRLCKAAGITKRITPHSLRHTFVTMALNAGVSERDLMDSTGHTTSKMIQYYDRERGSIERNATHTVAAFVGAAA